MSRIKVVRTYEVEVEDKALEHIKAVDASVAAVVDAASRSADGGNLVGTIGIYYYWDEDEQLGVYNYDNAKDRVENPFFLVDYRAREISSIIG